MRATANDIAPTGPRRGPPDIAGPLLAWFARERRALPWREEPRDPYRTWLSEVMAQQTRLDVVVPYFERFVRRLPTLHALAAAPVQDVLALWSGLGYYARARNLHRAAQAAVALHGGRLPRTARELGELPGFGPYTAAAVASLAFGEDVPLVDGNVARVLARLLRLPGDALSVRKPALEAAAGLLPAGRAGPFNEALMELGATVCTPRAPKCAGCPLRPSCGALAGGDPESVPAPKPRRERPKLHWVALALQRADGSLLFARRPPGELFEGLWELPTADAAPGRSPLEAARAVLERHGLSGSLSGVASAGRVQQVLTHREVTIDVLRAGYAGRAPRREALRWVAPRPDALAGLGLSSLAAKVLRACGVEPPPRPRRP